MEEMQVSHSHSFDGTLKPNRPIKAFPAEAPAGLPIPSKIEHEYEALLKKKLREDRIKNGIGRDWSEFVHVDR